MLVKNTFGVSAVLGTRQTMNIAEGSFTGSSLDRKKLTEQQKELRKIKSKAPRSDSNSSNVKTSIDMETGEEMPLESVIKRRKMSQRTKTKIRIKLMAFSQIHKNLTFVTLTFVNNVTDKIAVLILKKFLDNFKKRNKDFEYLWVAERQEKNKTFEGNIHFHLVTNKHWDIKKTWKYWIELQAKNNIVPRDENFRPASAFDVKSVSSKNPRQLGTYLTKYISKSRAEFDCQVWNCSQGISKLYTAFYTSYCFIEELRRLKGEEIVEKYLEFCTLLLIPLDKTTFRFYDRLEVKNKSLLQ